MSGEGRVEDARSAREALVNATVMHVVGREESEAAVAVLVVVPRCERSTESMIHNSRLSNALAAINAVLVAARAMAYERRPHEELVEVLDVAEYLPRLLAQNEERSTEFREQLAGLASKYPSVTFVVERFDDADLGGW